MTRNERRRFDHWSKKTAIELGLKMAAERLAEFERQIKMLADLRPVKEFKMVNSFRLGKK